MPEETISSKFPQTSQDIKNLKQTATDAKDHLQHLKEHAVSETGDQLQQIKSSLSQALGSAKSYASERPLLCVGIALGVGLLWGMSRRSSRREIE